jgi:hypothetical protein
MGLLDAARESERERDYLHVVRTELVEREKERAQAGVRRCGAMQRAAAAAASEWT